MLNLVPNSKAQQQKKTIRNNNINNNNNSAITFHATFGTLFCERNFAVKIIRFNHDFIINIFIMLQKWNYRQTKGKYDSWILNYIVSFTQITKFHEMCVFVLKNICVSFPAKIIIISFKFPIYLWCFLTWYCKMICKNW